MIIKLTSREVDLLDHRLSVPDCIADGLEDEFDRDAVEDAVTKLIRLIRAGAVDVSSLDEIDREVLSDCIEGSTWIAAANSEAYDADNPAIRSGAMRTIRQLAAKLRSAGVYIDSTPVC